MSKPRRHRRPKVNRGVKPVNAKVQRTRLASSSARTRDIQGGKCPYCGLGIRP